jgi:hypothetical protein
MALENLVGADKFISALVPTNPTGGDDKREGDDHLRGVKNVLKNSFPNIDGAVTATDEQLSSTATPRVAIAGDTMTGSLRVPAGTALLPGLQVAQTNIGLMSVTSALGFVTGGVEKARLQAAGQGEFSVNSGGSSGGWSLANRGLVNIDGSAGAILGLSYAAARIGSLAALVSSLELGTIATTIPLIFKISGVEKARIDGDGTFLYQALEVGWRNEMATVKTAVYTLVDADRGTTIQANAGCTNINVPQMSAGSVVGVWNNSGVAMTLTATGGVAFRWGSPAVTTTPRTVGLNGLVQLWWPAAGFCVITGTGIT